MKIEELLQKILDIASQDEVVDQTEFQSPESEEEPIGVFMPPLQMSIELMKKSAGVDNVIDDEESEEYEDEWQEMADDDAEDQLLAIRRNAGLPYGEEPINPEAVIIANSNTGLGL
jgi:hypothetical protein